MVYIYYSHYSPYRNYSFKIKKTRKWSGTLYWRAPNHIIVVVLKLFQLNYGTSLFDSLLQVLSLCLCHTLLDSSRSTINEILSFLQTKTTSLLNSLNNLELVSAYLFQNNVERRLLLSSLSGTCSSRTSSNCNSCSGGLNSILVLQDCS